ncbi:N-acetylneuraminate synthase family protein [Nitrospira sp. Kam-Ns4a]
MALRARRAAGGTGPAGSGGTGTSRRSYVLARVTGSHLGDLDQARRLVDAAVACGCDGIRFDKRSAADSVVQSVLNRPLSKYPRLGRTVREVVCRLDLPAEAFRAVREHCRGRIEFVAAPFDLPSLRVVDEADADGLMVDAAAANNRPLVRELAARQKRVFLATGLLSEEEIEEAVEQFRGHNLTLLHSIFLEPFEVNLAYLTVLTWLERFGRRVGYTDNEPGVTMVMGALGLGATVIEKALTLDKDLELPHGGGLSPAEMGRLVRTIRETDKEPLALVRKKLLAAQSDLFDDEQVSLVAARAIPAGTVLTEDLVALKAPYRGLSPRLVAAIVGKRTLYDLEPDDFITFGVIEP